MATCLGGLAFLLVGSVAQAQLRYPATPDAPPPGSVPPTIQGTTPEAFASDRDPQTDFAQESAAPPRSLEAESLPREIAEDIRREPAASAAPGLGPTPVDEVGFLMNNLGLGQLFGTSGIRAFGWVEGGYTAASSGSGPLAVQPRLNRFGNEFLLNEIGLVLQKPLYQDRWDWGFNVRYFAGANAATGQPGGGIDDPPGDPRFSQDFRDLYLSAHLPIITESGVNVKVGRMNTIIGWNGYLAPYRPLYSSDYQFFYSQDGAFTGFLAQLVVDDQLDVWGGMTLGANTFFERRSEDSYCYIAQVNYWLTTEQRTRLTASTYLGPDAIFAAPDLNGDFVTMVELRVQQNWSEWFTQVVQSNFGWDANTPVGTGSWVGVYTLGICHLTSEFDLIGRVDWFRDVKGTRTGIDTAYTAITLGSNWHPVPCIEIRSEIRADFAGDPAFGTDADNLDRDQVTAAISFLTKF